MRVLHIKRSILAALAIFCLLMAACGESEADNSAALEIKKSRPFVVVDLDGDGVEIVSLEKSDIFTDVDGDGFAERTEWVSSDDGLLGLINREEYILLPTTRERFAAIFMKDVQKLRASDQNRDSQYDKKDFINGVQNLGILIAQDKNSSGMPETNRTQLLACDFQSITFNEAGGTIDCGEQSFDFKNISFKYTDDNAPWAGLCEKIINIPGEKEEFQKYCIEK